MSTDEHPIYSLRRQAAVRALTNDDLQRYYNEFWTPEMTAKRKQKIDSSVRRRENEYYTRIISKIQALKHDVLKLVKSKPMTTMDKAVAKILKNDPEYQSWIKDQPRRKNLFADAMNYLDAVHHAHWEIKNSGAMGIKEPVKGDISKRAAWEEWQAECHRDALNLGKPKVSLERQKLANVFKDADQKRRNKNPVDDFMKLALASRGVEE